MQEVFTLALTQELTSVSQEYSESVGCKADGVSSGELLSSRHTVCLVTLSTNHLVQMGYAAQERECAVYCKPSPPEAYCFGNV